MPDLDMPIVSAAAGPDLASAMRDLVRYRQEHLTGDEKGEARSSWSTCSKRSATPACGILSRAAGWAASIARQRPRWSRGSLPPSRLASP
jgi:hypothetical protein